MKSQIQNPKSRTRDVRAASGLRFAVCGSLLLVLALAFLVSCGGASGSARTGKSAVADSTKSKRRPRKAAGDTLVARGKSAVAAGKRALAKGAKGKRGSLAAQTPDAKLAEKKRLKEEKRRLRDEMRRRKQEEKLAQQSARGKRAKRTAGKRSLYDAYTLKATIAGHYALIGNRRLEPGDIIAGKKIVSVESDRVVLEQFGTSFTVRIGEPVQRMSTTRNRRQK
jgi:hypothetical protein